MWLAGFLPGRYKGCARLTDGLPAWEETGDCGIGDNGPASVWGLADRGLVGEGEVGLPWGEVCGVGGVGVVASSSSGGLAVTQE